MMILNAFLYHLRHVQLITSVLFTFIIINGVYTLSDRKSHFYFLLAFAALTIGSTWYEFSQEAPLSPFLDEATNVLFFAYLVVTLGKRIFKTETITSDTVFGTLCLYFMIAMAWGFLYSILYITQPNSFYLGNHPDTSATFLYYSFVTLTTLGYGDIIPQNPPAQVLAALEAVMGQIYLTVVVARFVSLMAVRGKSS